MSKNNKEFPTGKQHVSFSEIKSWKECSWRHKLVHIDKIDMSEPSPFLDFGTAVHEGCETYLKTKKTDKEKLFNDIRVAWDKYGFDNPEWIKKQPAWYLKSSNVGVDRWCEWAENMWNDVPSFLDETFPGWECFEAEEMLYEAVENKDLNFKGYIDGIIKVPKKKGEGYNYWIIDWKTANTYGWRRSKKQDILMTSQLILYKNFWSRKHNIDLKDVRCGFILLKRGAKPGKVCELVTVSVGPKSLERAGKILNNMITSVRRGIFLKNRESCRYCQFKDTKFCT